MHLPKLFKSASKSSFENILNVHNEISQYKSEDFREAFEDKIADRITQDYVELADIPSIVLTTLGRHASEFIIDKISKMASEISVLHRVHWNEFSTQLDKVLSIIYEETSLHREKPYETYANIPLDKVCEY